MNVTVGYNNGEAMFYLGGGTLNGNVLNMKGNESGWMT
jgi:hypothetical protein